LIVEIRTPWDIVRYILNAGTNAKRWSSRHYFDRCGKKEVAIFLVGKYYRPKCDIKHRKKLVQGVDLSFWAESTYPSTSITLVR
jgi:hypothetical protein